MCTISYVGDYWRQQLPQQPYWPQVIQTTPEITRAEFEQLKRDMEELKKLLLAAKAYDDATGQPDCETESKVELIRKLAKLVGVDLGDVF